MHWNLRSNVSLISHWVVSVTEQAVVDDGLQWHIVLCHVVHKSVVPHDYINLKDQVTISRR